MKEDVWTCLVFTVLAIILFACKAIVDIESVIKLLNANLAINAVLTNTFEAVSVDVVIDTVESIGVSSELTCRVPSCNVPVLKLLKNRLLPVACSKVIPPVLKVVTKRDPVVIVEVFMTPPEKEEADKEVVVRFDVVSKVADAVRALRELTRVLVVYIFVVLILLADKETVVRFEVVKKFVLIQNAFRLVADARFAVRTPVLKVDAIRVTVLKIGAIGIAVER
jgi:hypothetical protein